MGKVQKFIENLETQELLNSLYPGPPHRTAPGDIVHVLFCVKDALGGCDAAVLFSAPCGTVHCVRRSVPLLLCRFIVVLLPARGGWAGGAGGSCPYL